MTAKNDGKATSRRGGHPNSTRYALMALLTLVAFFGAYKYVAARSPEKTASPSSTAVASVSGASESGASCACCGGGGDATPIEGTAEISDGVQKITVDMSGGGYNPNVIKLKAGIPAEITFGQSGSCTAFVQSSDLGFSEDLTAGPKTVKLQGLEAGTYQFACGMSMVFGTIVVE